MQTALIAKPLLARPAGRQTRQASRARNVTVFAAERPTWYPGAKPPKYLTGTMPGYVTMLCCTLGAAQISFYLQPVDARAHRCPSLGTGTTALIPYVTDRAY